MKKFLFLFVLFLFFSCGGGSNSNQSTATDQNNSSQNNSSGQAESVTDQSNYNAKVSINFEKEENSEYYYKVTVDFDNEIFVRVIQFGTILTFGTYSLPMEFKTRNPESPITVIVGFVSDGVKYDEDETSVFNLSTN